MGGRGVKRERSVIKLYAICLVKNEDDVIAQTVNHALRYCDRILVIDNGSTDETWRIVRSLAEQDPRVVPFMMTHEPYDEGLRWLAYEAYHRELRDQDWWLILDGDEFLAEDPQPVLKRAAEEGADIVNAWQIQFYYTDQDYREWLAGRDARHRPIYERRRYYRIDWSEPRLFRNRRTPNTVFRQSKLLTDACTWGKSVTRIKGKVSRFHIFNRHFQYRDPEQIEKRLKLRYGKPEFAAQVTSLNWRSTMREARRLHYYRDGDPWRFTVAGLVHCYSGRMRYVLRSRYERAHLRLRQLAGSPAR